MTGIAMRGMMGRKVKTKCHRFRSQEPLKEPEVAIISASYRR